MTRDIREESGVMLTRRRGFHLLNLEALLKCHPVADCRQLKTPELAQWDDVQMFVLEAKSSSPNPNMNAPSVKLMAAAEAEKCRLLSNFEQYRSNLYAKFISALVCMGEDGKHAVLQSHHDLKAYVDDESGLTKLHLSKLQSVLLLVLIPGMPNEYLQPMQDRLYDHPLMTKIKALLPSCDFRVINSDSATRLKLARCL